MEKDEKSDGIVAQVSKRAAEREGVLEIAPRIYREYADEFRELARMSESEQQRSFYLKAAHTWLDAAMQFEMSDTKSGSLQKPAA
jgi:hypothetical protein